MEERQPVRPRMIRDDSGQLVTELQQVMDKAGVSYRKLSDKSGVSRTTLNNVARNVPGKSGIDLTKAQKVAASLGVPVNRLFVHKNGNEILV